MTTTSDSTNYTAQCWLLYRGVLLSLLSQLTSLSLVMVFVCSHTSSCIQMVRVTGELVSPGQSFHQWTHLGEEISAHLGLFAAHGDCIINSWSDIMAEVPLLKQLLHAKPQHGYFSHAKRSILLSTSIKRALCCGGLLLQKHIFMPRLNDIYRLCLVSPWTAVDYILPTRDVPQKDGRPGPFRVLGGSAGRCHTSSRGITGVGK